MTKKHGHNPAVQKPETTGHQWDGIEELNNPLPRWWLWIFYATIIWGAVYMVLYPAVPLLRSATQGVLGYDSRGELQAEITHWQSVNADIDARLVNTDLTAIQDSGDVAQYAFSGGAAVFKTYCEQCHGVSASGFEGYPNLLDDDWLWGGSITDIDHTIRHGIRSEDSDDTRYSEMPAFGELLEKDDLTKVLHYTLSLSGKTHNAFYVSGGADVFAENCADCHGVSGRGNREFGAPDLTDQIWLYGQDQRAIADIIRNSRHGVMPAWQDRLTESQLRQVAYYVHQLGGGE